MHWTESDKSSLLLVKISKQRETGSRKTQRSLTPHALVAAPTACALGGGSYAALRKDWAPGQESCLPARGSGPAGQHLGPDCSLRFCSVYFIANLFFHPSFVQLPQMSTAVSGTGRGMPSRNSQTFLCMCHGGILFLK